MGIASALFWIMFGILYCIYRCFKDDPEMTSAILIVGSIFTVIIVSLCLVSKSLAAVDYRIAIVFCGIILCIFLCLGGKYYLEDKHKKDMMQQKYKRYLEILYSMDYSEEDFEKYLEKWKNGGTNIQIDYRYARTQEQKDIGRHHAFTSYMSSIGKSAEAWRQVKIEYGEIPDDSRDRNRS